METPKIGAVLTEPAFRDAIHVPVCPVVVGREYAPGEHVCLARKKTGDVMVYCLDSVGLPNAVIDPFLTEPVKPGQTCYVFVRPGVITSLRHAWTL